MSQLTFGEDVLACLIPESFSISFPSFLDLYPMKDSYAGSEPP
jgi:hypothetical protein